MNCLFAEDGESDQVCGWHKYRCERCGRIGHSPYGIGKVTGPDCAAWPFRLELGHWLTLLLKACWIRKRDYLWLKSKLGLAPKCGCGDRERKLNRWGSWLWGRG
jgi:hypothetical protein